MSGLQLAIRAGLAVSLIVTVGSRPADAQLWVGAGVWSTTGSTGIADEASASILAFDSTNASFRASAPAGSVATIRYPVASLPEGGASWAPNSGLLYFPYTRVRLTLALRKNEDGAYAAAMLKRVRLADGSVSVVASVNSVELLPDPGVQIVERTVGCPTSCFLGNEYAYYIEALLWRPYVTNDPRVVAIKVRTY